MNVYGELKRAQLEYLGAAPTVGVKGRVYWRSDLLGAFVDNGTLFSRFLLNDQKMVVGTSGTAGNNVRLYRTAAAKLQLTIGSDTTAEGTPSTSFAQLSYAAEQYTTGTRPAASGAAVGQLILNTTDYVLEWQDGTQWYRRYDGGTASDYQRLVLPGDTAANLALLTKKAGAMWYGTDTLKTYLSTAGALLQIVNAGVGTSGQVPVADGSNGYAWTTLAAGSLPNYLINGNFDFWQRGTSVTVTDGTSGYGPDRWYVKNSAGGGATITMLQTTGVTAGSKYGCSVKYSIAGTSNGLGFYQVLENPDALLFYNQAASVGAMVKALGNVTQVGIQFFYATSEVKLTTAIGSEVLTTVNSATFTLCQVQNQAIGTSMTTSGVVGVRIRITAVSSGNLWDNTAGFVVEQGRMNLGSLLGNFQRNGISQAGELLRCQRFYYRYAVAGILGTGYYDGTNTIRTPIAFPVVMRTTPTPNQNAAGNITARRPGTTATVGTVAAFSATNPSNTMLTLTTSAASTVGFGTTLETDGVGYFEADAEI